MRWFAGLLVVGLAVPAFAEDFRLNQIRALLEPMRAKPEANLETRGATPQLTVVKHELRDWIESRLGTLAAGQDPALLAHQLNNELTAAGLTCDSPKQVPCPDESILGFLGEITLTKAEFLVVQTGVGILCGFDESAYAYQWDQDHWQRFWQSERDDYSEKRYLPQRLVAVLISPSNYEEGANRSERLVLTLGVEPWCSSNWHPVYYRVWQTKAGLPEPKLLLDESEISFEGYLIEGRARATDVLIEYAVGSIDVGVHNRREIRHYVLKDGKLERVDPLVLSPRDFADEWVSHPWAESSRWTEPAELPELRNWHERTGKNVFGQEFIYPTMHCREKPDFWQVGIESGDPEKEQSQEYFLIRWRPPYHFTMVGVSDHPWADCTEEDREADEERTLFPNQWR